jgi:adenosylmethionine-8-amino-7-oxononanoate aminotransferase
VSLLKIGNRSAALDFPIVGEERPMGIPGSGRVALFYQQSRQLPVAERAEGIHIWDTEGRRYLDGCSGACTVNVGHANERVIRRAQEQMRKICFAYRTQFETDASGELADMLVRLSPPELDRVFFVNSGSEAVEAAVKLARQFWWVKGRQGKQLVISRCPSYHGATLGALSLTAYAPLNIPFHSMQIHAPRVSAPFCYHCPLEKSYPGCGIACAYELERAIQLTGADNVAAFIAEPIGGATSGGAVPPEEYFHIVERICHDNEVVLIIDDVLTGCGRTGPFYGYAHWNITPDIVTLAKGLSGGYTPIGAVVACDDVVSPVLESGGFMHGHTYAGNPLSTAVAAEVVRYTIEEGLLDNSGEMGTYMHERLRELKDRYSVIGDVRGRGLLAGVEIVSDRTERRPFPGHWWVAQELTEIARELGLLVYPRRSLFGLTGDHVLLAPPLVIDRPGVDELVELFEASLERLVTLLEKHVVIEEAVVEDGTHERFEQTADLPEYATGAIDEVEPAPEANVTWTMLDPEVEPPAYEGMDSRYASSDTDDPSGDGGEGPR